MCQVVHCKYDHKLSALFTVGVLGQRPLSRLECLLQLYLCSYPMSQVIPEFTIMQKKQFVFPNVFLYTEYGWYQHLIQFSSYNLSEWGIIYMSKETKSELSSLYSTSNLQRCFKEYTCLLNFYLFIMDNKKTFGALYKYTFMNVS